MRVLVTGAAGLLGSQTVKQLRSEGHEVFACVRPRTPKNIDIECEYLEVDLAGHDFVSKLPAKMDAIIHLAQSNSFREFPDRANDVFGVNLMSTAALLNYAKASGVSQFVLASSGSVYGTGGSLLEEEDVIPLAKLNYYAATKLSSELLANSYREIFSCVCLRYFFVFGPGQKKEMLMPRLVDCVERGQAINLVSERGLRINPIGAKDAARATTKALELNRNEVINVAGNETTDLKEIVTIIGAVRKKEPVLSVTPGEQPSFLADTTKMSEVLGMKSGPIVEAIQELAQDYGKGDS